MHRLIRSLVPLLSIAAACAGCVQNSDDPPEEEDVSAAEQELVWWTGPRLEWILLAAPGTARLARRSSSTTSDVTVVRTHTLAAHWQPVSVAGNKLLWQRSDTGQMALWTIDNDGNHDL